MMNDEQKNQVLSRLKRIEGQVRGLQKMVEEDRYCIDIITQTASVVAALHGVEDFVMEQHLQTCVTEAIRRGDMDQKQQKIDEIMNVLSRFRRTG
ncbi:MAG: metal-sensitive transcriptional regulator [Spirochaetota bacterium]